MLALTIVLFATGIYILAKGRIDFWAGREIIRPKSTYLGIALIVLGISSFFLNFYTVIGLFILIFVVEYFLSQKKNEMTVIKNKNHSTINLLILIIIAALIAFIFWYFTKI